MIIRLIVYMIELPVIFITELIQELSNSKVIQKFGNTINDITINCICNILSNEHVQECTATIVAEGMNTFLQQPDLDVHIRCMADTMSKTQPELARKQGEDFPIVVGSFLQGMLHGKQQQQQQQQQNNNIDTLNNDNINKRRNKSVSLSPTRDRNKCNIGISSSSAAVNSVCSSPTSYHRLSAAADDNEDDCHAKNNNNDKENDNKHEGMSSEKVTTNNTNNTFDIPKHLSILKFPTFRKMATDKSTNSKEKTQQQQQQQRQQQQKPLIPQRMDSDTSDPVEVAASILAETASLVTDNDTITTTTTTPIIGNNNSKDDSSCGADR